MQRKHFMALAFTLVLILALSTSSFAETNEISPYYSYTSRISAILSISGGVATCTGEARPTYVTTSADLRVKLQRLVSEDWVTIATWTDSAEGSRVVATGTKTVSSGFSYRVLAEVDIKDQNGKILETVSKLSAIVDY